MTVFQLLMLGASAFFAFKIYEHIQTLQDPQGESDKDVNDSKSINAFSPFSPEALVEKADKAYEEEDFQKAVALLIEANAKDPSNAEILFKLGYILQQIGSDEEAIERYKESLEIDKENEFVHNAIASVYRNKSEYASAELHLRASLELNSENPVTYYNFGNLLVDMKKNLEAKGMYEKAVELNPDFAEAKQELQKLQES